MAIIPVLVGVCIVVFVLLLGVWVIGFTRVNDMKVHTSKINYFKNKKILVIFPHADDEVLSMGGLLSGLTKNHAHVSWLVLTKGERGTTDGSLNQKLKLVRTKEAQKVSQIYKVTELIQWEFPDNRLSNHKNELTIKMNQLLKQHHPDVIFTYDLSGLYGHPDHITVSEIVTSEASKRANTHLYYITYPKKVLDLVNLPVEMSSNNNYINSRTVPTIKICIGFSNLIRKITAVYAYTSQKDSFIKSFPYKQIPLWFYISLTPYEYFHKVK